MFLRAKDYQKQINDEDLGVITNNDPSLRIESELAAQKEISSYLKARYNVSEIFIDLLTWDIAVAYTGTDLFQLIADDYAALTPYSLSDLVNDGTYVYKCIQAGTGQTPASSPLYWTNIGLYEGIYSVVTDETPIAGTAPNNTTYFENNDTRDAQIKMYAIDITLYHLHSTINPRNIPQFRIARRDDAIKWLKMIAMGDISCDLPPNVDADGANVGLRIRYGSQDKLNHNY